MIKSQFLNKALFVLSVASFTFFQSCKEEDKDVSKETTEEVTGTNEAASGNTDATSASGTAELNPKHGEPGHRCDLPVGAPLDGGKQTKQTAPTSNGVSPVVEQQPEANPPHGQPGHDCGKPVGAPLD